MKWGKKATIHQLGCVTFCAQNEVNISFSNRPCVSTEQESSNER